MNKNLKNEINNLPSVSDIIKEYNLSAKKKLSQNYLLDLNLTEKIIKICGNIKNIDVIEVGPGPGSLTRSILANGAKRVIAIEKDKRFIDALKSLKIISNNKLIIKNEDALNIEFKNMFTKYRISNAHIISNLPYSIGTKLLLKWLPMPSEINKLTLMFQKEVAERIVAKSGTKKYGRLSVLVGIMTDAKIIMHIPAAAFKPKPKIDSSIVEFKAKNKNKFLFKVEILEEITRIIFNKRRKQVKSALKYFGDPILLCKKMNIDPSIRAEQITPESFEKLAIEITNYRQLQI